MAGVKRVDLEQDYITRIVPFKQFEKMCLLLLNQLLQMPEVQVVTSRVKEIESFVDKASRVDQGQTKYTHPFDEINDIVGFRVIVIAKLHIPKVCKIIEENFEVLEQEDKSVALLNEGKLGYESHHLIVKLNESRKKLAEYASVTDIVCEIQVRTVLQHAWAENEHKIQYKDFKPDPDLRRRFQRLAGLMSLADEEFDRIYELNERVRNQVENSFEIVEQIIDLQDKPKSAELGQLLSAAANLYGVPARELVASGRYRDAIRVYDQLIGVQAKNFSHYIGRANAKARSGEISDALSDVVLADQLMPNNPAILGVLGRLEKMIDSNTD